MLRVAGSGLLIAAGAIHLDLYLTGYRTIPTIGWLFLLQVISAFGLGLAVLVTGGWPVICRLAAAGGAGFALATLGGYLLSVWTGLFGFREVRTTAGIVAGMIDVVAFAGPGRARACPCPGGRHFRDPGRQSGGDPVEIPRPDLPDSRHGHVHQPADHHDRWDDGTDQRQRLYAVLVRPRHADHVEVLRHLRRVLAAGSRHRRA